MSTYAIYLPIDNEYLKVDGTFFFEYDVALENLELYKKRMVVMYKEAKDDPPYQKLLMSKIRSAKIVEKVSH